MVGALTLPQYLYLAVAAAYLLMFLLFCRLLLWKRYAERHYWRRRPRLTVAQVEAQARALGRPLPFFSILIPARNEAEVIEGTVDHMAALDYPPDRYEIVVVTDEKEQRAADQRRPGIVREAAETVAAGLAALEGPETRGEGPAAAPLPDPPPEVQGLVLGLLARLATEGGSDPSLAPLSLTSLPEPVSRQLIWEAARRLYPGRRWGLEARLGEVEVLLRRRLRQAREKDSQAAFAALLAHGIPVVVAMAALRQDPGQARLVRHLAARVARAHHSLTQEILVTMAEALAGRILERLRRLRAAGPEALRRALEATYREVYPTTQDILARKVQELARQPGRPRLVHVTVPFDFDGRLGGGCTGREVPSTKGRALNWGLGFVDPRAEWCGFYDAESRPDPGVLLYVAHRWLQDLGPEERPWRAPRVGRPVQIFQGPVFQVRNFYEMGPFCKIASLYQAVAHDWYLPALFRHLPFVGGTNLFVTADLLRAVGGYDHQSLTEDLELGTRAYLRCGAWPEYLPLPSSEQTPPTFAAFFRQRLRWATGHLQVMDKIRRETGYPPERRRAVLRQLFRKGQREWVFYQAATLVPPAALVAYYLGLLDPAVLPAPVRACLSLLSLIYVGFTLYAFRRYAPHLDTAAREAATLRSQALAVVNLLLLPLAAFLFPVPYSSALVLRGLGRSPQGWVKTPRTRE
ncbi:MAG: glycosyltransferase family 2 protein [Bacillota bacterium]